MPRATARQIECIVLSSPLSELHTGPGPRLLTASTMRPGGRLRNTFRYGQTWAYASRARSLIGKCASYSARSVCMWSEAMKLR